MIITHRVIARIMFLWTKIHLKYNKHILKMLAVQSLQNNIDLMNQSPIHKLTIQIQINELAQRSINKKLNELQEYEIKYYKILDKNINLDDPQVYQLLQDIYAQIIQKQVNLKLIYMSYPQYCINLIKIFCSVDLHQIDLILYLIDDMITNGSQYSVYFANKKFISYLLRLYTNINAECMQENILKVIGNLVFDYFEQMRQLYPLIFDFLMQIQFGTINTKLYDQFTHLVYIMSLEYKNLSTHEQIQFTQIVVDMYQARMSVAKAEIENFLEKYANIFYNIELCNYDGIVEITNQLCFNIFDQSVMKYVLFLLQNGDKLFQCMLLKNSDFQAFLNTTQLKYIKQKLQFVEIMIQQQYDNTDYETLIILKNTMLKCIHHIHQLLPKQYKLLQQILLIASGLIEILNDNNDVKDILSHIQIQYQKIHIQNNLFGQAIYQFMSTMQQYFNQL